MAFWGHNAWFGITAGQLGQTEISARGCSVEYIRQVVEKVDAI